ncbi:MAG: hypothetical protein GWP06_15970 [Actinobacteria bacterium]|nr:hypothetical protein [Actinomycetota bacterium]
MARFPIRQADVLALAESIIAGLDAHTATYPTPPVSAADLRTVLDGCVDAVSEVHAARAAYEMAVAEKDSRLAELKDKMKKNLRYAENTVGGDDNQLNMLGWAGKREPASEPPGQSRELKVIEQGTDWLILDWRTPEVESGGKVAAYKIQRRGMSDGDKWIDAAVAIETKIKLTDQPRHTDLEYRVVAINKTGQGKESNTVAVVL